MLPFSSIATQQQTSAYTWDEALMRYRNIRTGRIVAFAEVERALERDMLQLSKLARQVSSSLVAGNIGIAQWQQTMLTLIKRGSTIGAIMARGGVGQMTQADWGWVGSEIKKQYSFLQNFVEQILSGKQPLNGKLVARAGMYPRAMKTIFSELQRRLAKAVGFQEERRILSPVEHCRNTPTSPGCVELSSMGWQPIGTLPAIGHATCLTNDRCHFEFRRKKGA